MKEENLKKLLKDLKEQENLRKTATSEIDAEIRRINLREETELERFSEGIKSDIESGLYNNTTEGKMQQLIDEENDKIKERYDAQRMQLNKKLQENEKQNSEEKANDYKKISSAIKDYHLEMVLAVNEANKKLSEVEAERNEKLQNLDKLIAEKEEQQTHMIMKNRNSMEMEGTEASINIRSLGLEIEQIKAEKQAMSDGYKSQIEEQNKYLQYCTQQRESAGKFLGQIILSNKSIDEIYDILFGKEEQTVEQNAEAKVEQPTSEQTIIPEEQREEPIIEEKQPVKNASEEKAKSASIVSPKAPNVATVIKNEHKIESEKPVEKSEDKKITYEFYANKIKYDGNNIRLDQLLGWYDEYKENIENAIQSAMGDKEEIKEFIESSDKLIYLSMIFKGSNTSEDKIKIDDETKARLEKYYNIWSNPKEQKESNMTIKYNLKGISVISRFINNSPLTDDDIKNVKENAFLLRNRKNVSIEGKGPLTALEFKIRDMIEKIRQGKLSSGENKVPTVEKEDKETEKSWTLTPEQKQAADPSKLVNESTNQQPEEEKQSEEQR